MDAAQCDGAAAQKRDEAKTAAYAARGDSGHEFIPFFVEIHGRLGQPAVALLETKCNTTRLNNSMNMFYKLV